MDASLFASPSIHTNAGPFQFYAAKSCDDLLKGCIDDDTPISMATLTPPPPMVRVNTNTVGFGIHDAVMILCNF